MSEFSINLSIILAALVLAFAVAAWIYIRNRQIGVKVLKIEFGQAQLRFARKQYTTQMRIAEQRHAHIMGGNFRPPGGPTAH